jgi:hypothetical protein
MSAGGGRAYAKCRDVTCFRVSGPWTFSRRPAACSFPHRDWDAPPTAHALLQSFLTISWSVEVSLPVILIRDSIIQRHIVHNLLSARPSVAAQARRGEAGCLGGTTSLSWKSLRKHSFTATSQTCHPKRRATASARPRSAFLQRRSLHQPRRWARPPPRTRQLPQRNHQARETHAARKAAQVKLSGL